MTHIASRGARLAGLFGLAALSFAFMPASAEALVVMPAQACQEVGTGDLGGIDRSEYRLARLSSNAGTQGVVCPVPYDIEYVTVPSGSGYTTVAVAPNRVTVTIQDQHDQDVTCRVAGRLSDGSHTLSAPRSTSGRGLQTLTLELSGSAVSHALRCDLPPHNVGGYTRVHDYATTVVD